MTMTDELDIFSPHSKKGTQREVKEKRKKKKERIKKEKK